jgi:uncharacterized protein (TIGR00251 family)
MSWFRWDGDDLLLTVTVQPRASRDELVANPDRQALKVRITAPPVDGKANAHLLRYLAKVFDVSRSQVTLVSGATSRRKRIRIHRPNDLPIEAPRP